MKTPSNTTTINTPRLFPTLIAGFNTVANHVQLIFLPLFVDLVLWLGPKIQLRKLLEPLATYMTTSMQAMATPDTQDQVNQSIAMVNQFIKQFNLNVLARTVPVGIPSLLFHETFLSSPMKATIASPIQNGIVFDAPSFGFAFIAVIALALVGFLLGTIYFNSLARFTVTPVLPSNPKKVFAQFGQSIVTTLILVAIVLIIMVPGITIMFVASMISATIGQFLILAVMFILLWLAIPLVFSPHGIFILNQKAYPSMMLSIRMVRFFLPGAGMYVLTSVLISEGFNMLWSLPDPSSWLMLVGIFGHAFVVTALLAASFIYYRGGLKWMQESIQNISDPTGKTDPGGPIGTPKQQ
jgi:hypothetical protein